MRKLAYLFVVGAMAMVTAGCGGAASPEPGGGAASPEPGGGAASPEPGGGGENVIRIGAAVSLTGSFARLGEAMKAGYDYWADYVNESGGIDVGGTKYQVEIIYADDQSDPDTGAKLTERLITEDKVDFLFGPFSSPITMATSTMGEKYNIITIAAGGNAPAIYERGYQNVFAIWPPGTTIYSQFMELAKTLGAESVAIMVRNDAVGLAIANGAKADAERLGLEVVYFEEYSPDAQDLSGALTRIKELNPDVLVASSLLQDSILVVSQVAENRVNVKMLGVSLGPEQADFIESLGETAEYAYGVPWWVPSLAYKDELTGWTAESYAQDFEQTYGFKAVQHAAGATAAGEVLQWALEQAGTLETEAVREQIRAFSFTTFFGPIGYDETGQNIAGSPLVIQIQNGTAVTVYPEGGATADPIYPMPTWDER